MNYRIVARSITIILRRRWRQADGKARIKNVKDGGYDYGLQAWDGTDVYCADFYMSLSVHQRNII